MSNRDRMLEIARFASEHGVKAATKEYRVSSNTVYKYLRNNNLRTPDKKDAVVSVSSFEILKMLLDGKMQLEASRKIGVTPQRVAEVARRARLAGFEV